MHSCAYYLQRLLRTIVGDLAFERAQKNVDDNIHLDVKVLKVELGTSEELIQD